MPRSPVEIRRAAAHDAPDVAALVREAHAFNAGARRLYAAEGFAPLRELLVWRGDAHVTD